MAIFPVHSERLILRLFKDEDLEIFKAYRSDPEIARFQSWSSFTEDDARQFIQEQVQIDFGSLGKWVQIAIADKNTGLLVGDMGLCFQAGESKSVEIGFTLAREFHKQGFAAEAVTLMLKVLFEQCDVERVVAITDAKNIASIALLQKVGMKQESEKQNYFKGALCEELTFSCFPRLQA